MNAIVTTPARVGAVLAEARRQFPRAANRIGTQRAANGQVAFQAPALAGACVNLTQHACSPDQAPFVWDLPDSDMLGGPTRGELVDLLTFDQLPSAGEVADRADAIATIAVQALPERGVASPEMRHAMIGGAPFLMGPLSAALEAEGIIPLFAFSVRESRDLPDGQKVSTFRHAGFVRAPAEAVG